MTFNDFCKSMENLLTNIEVGKVVAFFEANGYTVSYRGGDRIEQVRGKRHESIRDLSFRWEVVVVNGDKAFRRLLAYSHSSSVSEQWIFNILEKMDKEEIALPELLIKMPTPKWIDSLSRQWEFLSIAKEKAQAFMAELEKILRQ